VLQHVTWRRVRSECMMVQSKGVTGCYRMLQGVRGLPGVRYVPRVVIQDRVHERGKKVLVHRLVRCYKGVTGCNRVLQGVARCYRARQGREKVLVHRLRAARGCYKVLQGVIGVRQGGKEVLVHRLKNNVMMCYVVLRYAILCVREEVLDTV
jgi:hypothetical protein